MVTYFVSTYNKFDYQVSHGLLIFFFKMWKYFKIIIRLDKKKKFKEKNSSFFFDKKRILFFEREQKRQLDKKESYERII